jgi:succinoglycan biosynthesis protein ExoL
MPSSQARPALGRPNPDQPSVLVFSNDLEDARFQKRLQTFVDAGFSVRWLAYDRARNRGAASPLLQTLPGLVLGKTRDRQYLQRIYSMVLSVAKLITSNFLSSSDRIIYCINLDNLLVAALVASIRRLKARIVYEVADIHPPLSRPNSVGAALRAVERCALRHTDLLVYTSERFMSQFMVKIQGYRGPALLLENKIHPPPADVRASIQRTPDPDGHIVIGFFGQLKCRTSLKLIRELATAFPKKISFRLSGYPNHQVRTLFDAILSETHNVTYLGPYRYPADLGRMYGYVDLCWGFDFCSPAGNSKWCLANRLYEAGYFGVPMLVEDGTAGGDYVLRLGSGWALKKPLRDSLRKFFAELDAAQIQAKRNHIGRLDTSHFLLAPDLPRVRQALSEISGHAEQ